MILLKDGSYEWEDGRTALKNINLEIKKGEFVLISGKSGRSRSTLGNVMNGIVLLLEQKTAKYLNKKRPNT